MSNIRQSEQPMKERYMTTEQPPIIAHLDDIDAELARRAHYGTSFDPEKRGESCRRDYVRVVNGVYAELEPLATTAEQRELLAEEMERYRQGYVKHLTACLHSQSRCVSTMIAGPANFPVERQRKLGQWADNRRSELLSWDDRARAAIRQKLIDARPQEQKDAAEWAEVQRMMEWHLSSGFTGYLADKLERLARNGRVELVVRAIGFLTDFGASRGKPVFTPRHRVWTFAELAEQVSVQKQAQAEQPRKLLGQAAGVELWADSQIDRVQLVFEGKPGNDLRHKLSRSGWKWSPRNSAWQRQLTQNGVVSGKAILADLKASANSAAI